MDISSRDQQKIAGNISARLEYIARNNPKGVNKLAYKYGYPAPKENLHSKFNFLALFLQENGDNDKAIDELVMTHPDFGLFAETLQSKIKNIKGKSQVIEQQNEANFIDIEDFAHYDGFIDDNDTYNGNHDYSGDDDFIGGIISAVGNLGAAGINKIGAGKQRSANQKLAEEGTKQANTAVQVAAINAMAAKKQAEVDAKKSNNMIIALAIAGVLVILAIIAFFYFRRKK